MSVDISKLKFAIAENHHSNYWHFNTHIAHKILGAEGVTWKNASGLQSCAMRLSIALAYAGVHWPKITNSWRLKDTDVYFPSSAEDYLTLLANPKQITSAAEVNGKKGVIFFGPFAGATGHVTLWDGKKCHFDSGDAYWDAPTIRFWEMT